jgi:hypothetical protein
MTLVTFAQEYSELSSSEQTQFAETVRRLLSDGLIWREQEDERRFYSFLQRRRQLVADYLAVAGWELRHEERLGAFHVVHRDGAHRRRLNRETTVWLLLLRLMYAEKLERLEVGLTRYPVVEVSAIVQRYAEFFPGQTVRKRSSLFEALRTFQTLKLVRAAGGGTIRSGNVDQMIELLPTLEIIVPAANITALNDRLRTYDRTREDEDGGDSEEE